MPPAARHTFAALSPAERQASLRGAETWPVLSISEDAATARVYATARHYESNVNVNNVLLTSQSSVLASLALYWAVVTGKLKDLDVKTLRTHFPAYSWLSYQECVHLLLDYATGKPATDRDVLLRAAISHCREFGDDSLRNLAFEDLLDVLGWVTAVRPVVLRFPLIHWLTLWAATHRGLQLAYPTILVLQNDKGAKYPGPGPLALSGWQSELSEREKDGTLTYPSIRAELQARDALVQAGPNAPPAPAAWEEFLDAPPAHDPASIQSLLDNLSVIANYQAATLSSALALLARPYGLPARITTNLGAISTTAALVLGAKSVWEACPPGSRPRLAKELEQFVQKVTDKYGGPDLEAKQRATLTTLGETITRAAQRGFSNWAQAAVVVASDEALPMSTFTDMSTAKDPVTFRKSILATTLALTRPSQHSALVAVVQRALKPTAADGHAWFLHEGAPPPPTSATASVSAPSQPPPPAVAAPLTGPPIAQLIGTNPLPGLQPAIEPPAVSVVRVQGLAKLDPTEASAALSQLLEVPVYVTPSDVKAGFGFAAIPTQVYHTLFATRWTRTYIHPTGWEAVIHGRRDSTGEPFRADSNALSVPPSLRPGESPDTRASKRKKIESPPRPATRAATAAGVTRRSQESTAPGSTRTSSMWGGRRNN